MVRPTHARPIKALAVLMLVLLGLDLLDASCDPLMVSPGLPLLTDFQNAGPDPCGDTCVPDCFCCSSSVPAARLSLAWEPTPGVVMAAPLFTRLSPGFVQPLDHIPIAA